MADDGRPGWWMASDGQWYPPDQHPDPEHRARYAATPPPAPEPIPAVDRRAPEVPPVAPLAIEPKGRPTRGGRAVGVVVAAVLVLGAGVGAFLLSGGDDDDEASTDRTTTTADQDDDEGDGDETTTTEAGEEQEEATTTTEAEVVDPPFDAATVEVAEPLPFTFQVPEGLLVVQMLPTPQTGAELVPDDPDLAAAVDRIVAGLPGSVALVIDPAFDPVTESPPMIIAVAVQTPEEGVDAAGQAARNLADYQAGGITTSGAVDEVDDTTAVLRFTASGGSVNHQVFRSLGSSVVVFAAIGLDADVLAPVVDAVAATLVAG